MSLESTKRRVKRNREIILKTVKRGAIINGCLLLANRVFKKRFLNLVFVVTIVLETVVAAFLAYLVKPTIIKNSKGREIKDMGVDLTSRGVIRIFMDIIYTCFGTKLASLVIGSKAFIIMLIFIPITAYYEIFMRREVRKKQR
ncbi:hypothetical protein NEMIN01_2070 [Nematocida minor]|uniref:uncharacterized protein n=1 Tax=Nematocida minor TaxID=1912983 RepID=UPI0022206DB3|nr:uncharacterized protein NEMIN01_2070 [Nematocida minor]KAI5192538.1 hypothetical protein NEMIN01_2070 [Nematocida minor]